MAGFEGDGEEGYFFFVVYEVGGEHDVGEVVVFREGGGCIFLPGLCASGGRGRWHPGLLRPKIRRRRRQTVFSTNFLDFPSPRTLRFPMMAS